MDKTSFRIQSEPVRRFQTWWNQFRVYFALKIKASFYRAIKYANQVLSSTFNSAPEPVSHSSKHRTTIWLWNFTPRKMRFIPDKTWMEFSCSFISHAAQRQTKYSLLRNALYEPLKSYNKWHIHHIQTFTIIIKPFAHKTRRKHTASNTTSLLVPQCKSSTTNDFFLCNGSGYCTSNYLITTSPRRNWFLRIALGFLWSAYGRTVIIPKAS